MYATLIMQYLASLAFIRYPGYCPVAGRQYLLLELLKALVSHNVNKFNFKAIGSIALCKKTFLEGVTWRTIIRCEDLDFLGHSSVNSR